MECPALLVGNSVPIALAAGNTVVMKASEQTPRTHGLIAECRTEAGPPDGVYNLLTNAPEDAPEVVDELIAHPAVRRVHAIRAATWSAGPLVGARGRHVAAHAFEICRKPSAGHRCGTGLQHRWPCRTWWIRPDDGE